ncbi:MAG: 1,4-dihydroxy-2-naphthoate octaprenyltransferase, partial [Candidatus Omnitrophota bacterium]
MDKKSWYYAIRPWTFPAAISPVIAGSAMAGADGHWNFFAAISAMATVVLIQTGTNFVNDISDFKKGADTVRTLGPLRVLQAGLISVRTLSRAAFAVFAAAILIGLMIVMIQKIWLLIPVGLLCVAAGIFYTAGPYPAAYLGLGELMVIMFFGPVAAAGTYYLQAKTLTWPVVLAGLGCGLICCGILIINNYRDYEEDQAVGKKTLAVRFGRRFAQWEYLFVIVTAAMLPI